MNKGIFVTGTNTDVGKTAVTRGLACLLARRGVDVAAVKPVESGVKNIDNSDTAMLARAAGGRHPISDVTVYHFETPVSPHHAAAAARQSIEEDRLLSFLKAWKNKVEIVLAEGAGGLLVPLNERLTYADLIAQTSYAALIVAPDILGTINTTLLTIEAARHRNIPVIGVVLNQSEGVDLGNRDAIESFGKVRVLGTLPKLPMDDEVIANHIESSIDLTPII